MHFVEIVQNTLVKLGLGAGMSYYCGRVLIILAALLLCFSVDRIGKKYLLLLLTKIAERTHTVWDDILVKRQVFMRLVHLLPAILLDILAPVVFPTEPTLSHLIQQVVQVYIVFNVVVTIASLLDAVLDIYNTYQISKDRPIKAYIQVVKIIIYLLAVIFTISILLERSPWGLISGLGALTAILMLVFRDSILGFVASIQIVANNMVRAGDWIEMPKYGADGDVIDVSLTTVKVQNWDKTISTIPTYALVADSFKNWRGMSESGGRRIKRSIFIDMNSVKFCSAEMLERFRKISLLTGFLAEREQEIEVHNNELQADLSLPVNGRRLTNIGVFRAYLAAYLKSSPVINDAMTLLVRHLQPTEKGLPIEVYAFSRDKVWANYESIQADIFDHILAVLPHFDLRVFQNPSGYDFAKNFSAAQGEV